MIDKGAAYFLHSLPFFAGLPDEDVEGLCVASTVRDYEKGQHIFLRGDAADRFFVTMAGWIKVYRDTQDGDEAILGLFTRTDTFGDAVMFDAPYPYSAQAVEAAKVIAIPARVLKDRARGNPDIIIRMMQALSQHMSRLQLENEHLAIMSAPQRVGCLLLQLSSGGQGKERVIHFPYDKSLAASRLGMKPETFSRALAQLKSIGVATRGNDIQIPDFDALVDFVCSDCSAGDADCKFSSLHGCSATDRARCASHGAGVTRR